MDLNLLIPAVVLLVAVLVVIAVVVAAYREGKRAGEASKSERFDEIRSRLKLANTKWAVTYEDIAAGGETVEKSASIRFRQYGSRVIGEGADDAGRRWSIEGSGQEHRLCYLYLDHERKADRLGSVMVEMAASGDEMTGLRTSWSDTGAGLMIQRIRLTRESS